MAWLALIGSLVVQPLPGVDAVVFTAPETMARSADSRRAPPRFSQPLPAGTEARLLEVRPEWVRVTLFNGRDAWVPRSSAERVREPGDRATGAGG